jgi:hypothetical protein
MMFGISRFAAGPTARLSSMVHPAFSHARGSVIYHHDHAAVEMRSLSLLRGNKLRIDSWRILSLVVPDGRRRVPAALHGGPEATRERWCDNVSKHHVRTSKPHFFGAVLSYQKWDVWLHDAHLW